MLSGTDLRTPLANEGLLHFVSGATTGAERTGWIDVRHPVTGNLDLNSLPTDPINTDINHGALKDDELGYDRSDNFVSVDNKYVNANFVNIFQTSLREASPQIARDFNHANQLWAQAGLSVFNVGTKIADWTASGDPSAPFNADERSLIQGLSGDRNTDPTVVNNYYAWQGDKSGEGTYYGGVALPKFFSSTSSGFMVFDEARTDAFAHELGHFILNNWAFLKDPAKGLSSDLAVHSPRDSDLMTDGGPKPTPTSLKQGGQTTAFLNSPVGFSGTITDQTLAVYNTSPEPLSLTPPSTYYVQQNANNDASYGDRVDFHWVEDNRNLSGASFSAITSSTFIHRRPDFNEGTEPMQWGVGALSPAPSTAGHDLDDWLSGGESVLSLGAFTGPTSSGTFNVVDVFSQVAKYSDNDLYQKDISSGDFRRAAALDYEVSFSADGLTWHEGRIAEVFDDGWTMASTADDYVARWWSPVAAKHIRVEALGGRNDGNSQIDAIVAGTVANAITGTVFQESDSNAPNGILDSDDPRLRNWRVMLDHLTDNSKDREVRTDQHGRFAFTDVDSGAGNYQIVVTQPEGTLFTVQNAVGDDTDSDVNSSGVSNTLTVPTTGSIVVNAGTIDTSDLRRKEVKNLLELLGQSVDASSGQSVDDGGSSNLVTGLGALLVSTSSLPDIPFLEDLSLTDIVDVTELVAEIVAGLNAPVVLEADVTPSGVTLSNDAVLAISVDGAAVSVARIDASLTTDNTTTADLASDLDVALSLAGFGGQLQAVVLDDGRLAIENAPGASLESLSVSTLVLTGTALTIDPDVAEYGQLDTTSGPIANFTIDVAFEQRDVNGNLISPLTQQYIVPKIGTVPPGTTEVPFAFTQDNATLQDLADDLNASFLTAEDPTTALRPLTSIVAVVDPGADPNITTDDRLTLIAADPTVAAINIVANGERLGFSSSAGVSLATNTNPAVTVLGMGLTAPPASASQGKRVVAEPSFFSVDSFVDAVVDQLYAVSNLPLPDDFDPDPTYNSTTDTLEFNFALSHVFSNVVELDMFEGIDLGSLLGTLEVAALADADLSVQADLDFRVGFKLGELGDSFNISGATLLSQLNAGDGVDLLVGMTADTLTAQNGQIGHDVTPTFTFHREGGDVTTVQVTLPKNAIASQSSLPADQRTPNTSDNSTFTQLVDDLNRLFSQTTDEHPLSSGRMLSDVIEARVFESVDFGGNITRKVLLQAIDPTVLKMSVANADLLGFTGAVDSHFSDLSFSLSNGGTFEVNLDGAEDLADVKQIIETASVFSSSQRVQVNINTTTDVIDLVDLTLGSNRFTVIPAAAATRIEQQTPSPTSFETTSSIQSRAGLGLEILGDERDVDVNNDNQLDASDDDKKIEGKPLHGLGTLDRVYIVEQASGQAVDHKHIKLTATVESDIDVTAALGEVALDIATTDDDPLSFTVTADIHLSDPDSSGEIYMSEFTLDNLPTIVGVPMFAAEGSGTVEIALNVFDATDALDLSALFGETDPTVTLSFAFDSGSGTFKFTPDTNFDTLIDNFKDLGIEDIVGLLKKFVDELKENPDLDFLNKKIPLLDGSLNDVIDFADGVFDAADRLLSGIDLDDLVDIEAARLAVETAVSNLGVSVEQRDQVLRQLQVLRRVAQTPDQDQLVDSNNVPTDYLDRLPTRLLSAVAQLGKLIHRHIPDTTDGYGDLIATFKGLLAHVPALNSLQDRLAKALEDAINDAIKTPSGSPLTVNVTLEFADFDGVTTTAADREDRMLIMGIELSAPKLLQKTFEPEVPLTAEFGPVNFELDAELDIVAGGTISVGLAIDPRKTVDNDRFFLIVDNSPLTVPVTGIDLGVGLESQATGQVGFGSIGLISADAEFTILDAVQQVETAPTSLTIPLLGAPVYYRGDSAFNDDGRSMIVVVKPITGSPEVLSFSDGDYLIDYTGTPTLQILNSNTDIVGGDAMEIVIEYQTTTGHPTPNVPGPSVDSSDNSLMRPMVHPAGVEFAFTPNAALSNAIGAVAFGDLASLTTVTADIHGLVLGSIDGHFLSNDVENALVVVASLNHLLQPQITFDPAALGELFHVDFDLKTIVAGIDKLLEEIEVSIMEASGELPLAGDGLDMEESFIGKLRANFTQPLLDLLCNTGGTLEDIELEIEQFIFDKLGPSGLKILKDVNGPAGVDLGDVDVTLTPDKFEIDVTLGGRDEFILDFNFGPTFPLQGEGGLLFGYDFMVELEVGVSRTDGFYFVDQTNKEIMLDIGASLVVDQSNPSNPIPTSLELDLFGLKLSATDVLDGTNSGTYVTGMLNIDLTDGNTDGLITTSELTSRPFTDVFVADMTAMAEVNLKLAAGINDNLPSIETDLFVGTETGSVQGPWVATLDSSATGNYQFTTTNLTIKFVDLGINLGDFLSKHLGSVVRSVDRYIEPIKPVVELLRSEVPGASELSKAAGNGPVYFIDLAFANNPTRAAQARDFLDTVAGIINVIDSLSGIGPDDNLFVTLLSEHYVLGAPGALVGPQSDFYFQDGLIHANDQQAASQIANLGGGLVNGLQNVQGKLNGLLEQLNEIGVQIHLIETPSNIVNLLMGQPFDVVSWDLPRFELPFTFEAEFPVIPVPKINVRIGLDAEIFADLSVGYDSHGLETGNFFHGFYLGDREDVFVGADIDEFGLGLGVRLAALLDLLVVKAGVEGEIRADILANFRDQDDDGKLHADEIASIIRHDGIECLFDLRGEVTAIVRAVWEFTITGSTGSKEFINELLFSFHNECPKFETGHVSEGETLPGIDGSVIALDSSFADFNTAGTLVLHAGPFADQRGPGASSDTSEAFEVEELAPGVYAVRVLGLESRYSGVKRIYFSGGVGNDRLELIDVTVPVAAFGGAGDDIVHGTAEIDYLNGGAGNDELFGRGETDYLFGGTGNDLIFGDLETGNTDTGLWGTGAGDVIDAGAGSDTVYAGDGGDMVMGGAGDDNIYADLKEPGVNASTPGMDIVHAGSGDDTVLGGALKDMLFGDAGRDLLFGEDGDDEIEGGTGPDLLVGHLGDDLLLGGSGIDVIVGGLGADQLFGGRGNDLLAGGLATKNTGMRTAIDDVLQDAPLLQALVDGEAVLTASADGDDTLWGDEDHDLLMGDSGSDHLFGGWGNDVIIGHRIGDVSSTHVEYIEGGPDDDFICGTDGVDEIYGGTADAGLAHILASNPGTPSAGGFVMEDCESEFVTVQLPPTNSSISGVKFNDLNGDGLQDAGEALLAGWTLHLLDPDGEIIDSVITDDDGAYTFAALSPGDYSLSEEQQPDWVQTTVDPTLTLFESEDLVGFDFGNQFQGATIRGQKWHDLNGNGEFDLGEPGLDNWRIELLDEQGNVIASTITAGIDLDGSGSDNIDNDGDGNPLDNTDDAFTIDEYDERFSPDERGFYEFTDLPSGNYAVREVPLNDWIQSSPVIADPGGFRFLADDGFSSTRSNALSSVSGPITSLAVTLDIEHPHRSDLNVDLISPNGTRINLFTGVGGNVQDFSSITLADNLAFPLIDDISSNPSAPGYRPQQALGNFLGEEASGLWVLEIRDEFEGEAGRLHDWSLVINGQPPTVGGEPNLYQPGDAAAVMLTVAAGEIVTENFGNFRTATAEGTKFADLNGNGQWDVGAAGSEPGLAGVTIYADLNSNNQHDSGEPQTITQLDDPNTLEVDETGQYVLDGLPPGNYFIREVVANGYQQTFPDPLGPLAGGHEVAIGSGEFLDKIDFGNTPPASVHGEKWLDENGDGMRDENEPGLNGVVVYADINNNGQLDPDEPRAVTHSIATATALRGDYNNDGLVDPADYTLWRDTLGSTTNLAADGDGDQDVDSEDYAIWANNLGRTFSIAVTDGHYWLTEVPSGSEIAIREVTTEGLQPTFPSDGAHYLQLEIGERREGIDFGNAPAATIHGTKWRDDNGDGVRDDNEPGLDGVVIYADLNNNLKLDAGEPSATTMTIPNSADYNGDGSIDTGDYAVWRDTLGSQTDLAADGNANGVVDAGDYRHWRNQYGQAASGGASLTGETGPGHFWLEVPPGTTIIREVLPDGSTVTFPGPGFYTLQLAPGETIDGIDFGNRPSEQEGSIAGIKVFDENSNGIPDPAAGDFPMPNVTIYVDINGDGTHQLATEPSDVTDQTGQYLIVGVPVGTWQVREIVPPGHVQVFPTAPPYHTVTVNPGQAVTGVDFANFSGAASGGVAFGVGSGTPNALVALWDFENNLLDTAANYLENVGNFSDDLTDVPNPPGVGYTAGYVGSSAASILPQTRLGTTITGDLSLDDFTIEGYASPRRSGTIVETVDLSGNSTDFRLSWDAATQEVRLDLISSSGTTSSTTAPMPSGGVWTHFAIVGELEGATGLLTLTLYVDGMFVDTISDFDFTGISGEDRLRFGGEGFEGDLDKAALWNVVLAGGEIALHAQNPEDCYGLTTANPQTGEIHGLKWDDKNGDGRLGAGETGIAGVEIFVDLNDNGVLDPGEPFTTTMADDPTTPNIDETGMYWLTGLQPGPIVVREVAPTGFSQTFPSPVGPNLLDDPSLEQGTSGTQAIASDWTLTNNPTSSAVFQGSAFATFDQITGLWLRPFLGSPGAAADAVLSQTITLAVDAPTLTTSVWFKQEANYTAAATIFEVFSASGIGGSIDVSATTPNDGEWYLHTIVLSNLLAGDTVTVTASMIGGVNAGADPQSAFFDLFQMAIADGAHRISLGAGQVIDGINFGNQRDPVGEGSVHGQKWHDRNANGVRDPDEEGLDGWEIQLFDEQGNVVATTITMSMDLDGNTQIDPITEQGLFWFDNVPAGAYQVGEVLIPDWKQTVPDVVGVRQPGDANEDGIVDEADAAQVAEWNLASSGGPASWFQGDFNADGIVNLLDLAAAEANQGQTFFGPEARRIDIDVAVGQTVDGLEFANYEPIPLFDGDDVIYAGGADDVVRGDNLVSDPTVFSAGTRQDTIFGQGGADTLFGQEEDDILWGADPNLQVADVPADSGDRIHGGLGEDEVRQTVTDGLTPATVADQMLTDSSLTISYNSAVQATDQLASIERAILTGGGGNNDINAAAFTGPVQLFGLAGDDILTGGGADDLLAGGAGSDDMSGNAGDDRYLFEPVPSGDPLETDRVAELASAGTDMLDFSQLDTGVIVDLSGGLPGDRIAEQPGGVNVRIVEVITSGQEANFENIIGTQQDDTLTGNAADNVITALGGTDNVSGGGGGDLIDLGPGTGETADGGGGNDHYVFTNSWGTATISDPSGDDTIDFSAVTLPLDFVLGSLNVSQGANSVTHTGNDLEHVIGGQADDIFSFDDGAGLPSGGTIDGQGGTDLLDYSAYTTSVVVDLSIGAAQGVPGSVVSIENVTGGQAGDSITGDDNPNVILGGPGNDVLLDGRGGADRIEGGSGDDTNILGGAGDDLILPGAGDDTVDGEQGSDTYRIGDNEGVDTINDSGGAVDVDVLDLSQVTDDLDVDIMATQIVVNFLGGSEQITGNNAIEQILTGSGDDSLNFHAAATLPGTGTSAILAGGGIDTLDYSAYASGVQVNLSSSPFPSPVVAAQSATGVAFVTGINNLIGSNLQDLLIGDDGDNNIRGLGGNDELHGEAGDDILRGDSGALTAYGGDDDDTYIFVPGATTINIFEFRGTATAGQATRGGVDTLDFSAIPVGIELSLAGSPEIENLIGSATQRNYLGGNDKDNRLVGGALADILLGGNGNDELVGGLGRDILVGGDGEDTLIANDDNEDILISGFTAYEDIAGTLAHENAWRAIRDTWDSAASRVSREADITTGVGLPIDGGPFKLDVTTVTDDTPAVDTVLYDVAPTVDDWLFLGVGDTQTASLTNGSSLAAAAGFVQPSPGSLLVAETDPTSLQLSPTFARDQAILLLSPLEQGTEAEEANEDGLSWLREATTRQRSQDSTETELTLTLESAFEDFGE